MRLTTIALLALCALALASCDQAEPLARRAADRLQVAWHDADTVALPQFVASYATLADSLPALATKSGLDNAFVKACADINDTLGIAAEIIAYGEQAADSRASELVDRLLDRRIDARQACEIIGIAQFVAMRLQRPEWATTYCRTIDALARDLPLNKQMALYAAACPPAELARQLNAERNAPDADTALINRQVDALKQIYSAEQMTEFNNAYHP